MEMQEILNNSGIQIIGLFLANAALIFWMRTESRADWRHMDTKTESYMKEALQERKEFHERLFQQEKSFHERLLKIEMERKT